jgi:hypothetical protein
MMSRRAAAASPMPTSNHDKIVAKGTGAFQRVVLHVVDGLGLVHALLLRIQALLLPFKNLVFGGH